MASNGFKKLMLGMEELGHELNQGDEYFDLLYSYIDEEELHDLSSNINEASEKPQYGVHQFSTESIIFRGTKEECIKYIDERPELWDDAEVYWMTPDDPHYQKNEALEEDMKYYPQDYDKIELEYEKLDLEDRVIDWTYEVNKEDLYTFIFESCLTEQDFPAAFEDDFEHDNEEDWNSFVTWLEDNFDEIFDKYKDKIMDNYEEAAVEDAELNYDPDDYIDGDSMPGGHDDYRFDEELDNSIPRYTPKRYGMYWWGIIDHNLNNGSGLMMRIGENPNYSAPLDNHENKLLLFKSKELAQEKCDDLNSNINEEASMKFKVMNEARDPYFSPYGYRDAAKVLNNTAPEYYWHLKEIEMDKGDGIRLANYALKKGLPVMVEADSDPDYPTFVIKGEYHWDDYFYPYPSAYEEDLIPYTKGMFSKNESLVESTEEKICCICKKPFEGYGNNAEPVCSGTYCDKCNIERVIPMRFKMMKEDIQEPVTTWLLITDSKDAVTVSYRKRTKDFAINTTNPNWVIGDCRLRFLTEEDANRFAEFFVAQGGANSCKVSPSKTLREVVKIEKASVYDVPCPADIPLYVSIKFFGYRGIEKDTVMSQSLNEGNPVSGKIPESIDNFLQDIAQMYQTINYGDIMDHDYSEEDIKKLRSLRRKFREEAQYEGDEEAEAAMNDIAEKVAVILKAKNEALGQIGDYEDAEEWIDRIEDEGEGQLSLFDDEDKFETLAKAIYFEAHRQGFKLTSTEDDFIMFEKNIKSSKGVFTIKLEIFGGVRDISMKTAFTPADSVPFKKYYTDLNRKKITSLEDMKTYISNAVDVAEVMMNNDKESIAKYLLNKGFVEESNELFIKVLSTAKGYIKIIINLNGSDSQIQFLDKNQNVYDREYLASNNIVHIHTLEDILDDIESLDNEGFDDDTDFDIDESAEYNFMEALYKGSDFNDHDDEEIIEDNDSEDDERWDNDIIADAYDDEI